LNEKPSVEKIWAYVHGEMEAPERTSIERAAKQDAELAEEIQRVNSLNGRLRALLPLTEWTSEDLEDRILEALERDLPEGRAPSQPAEKPIVFPRIEIDISSWAIRWWATGIAAVAASLLVFGGVVHYVNGPVGWSQPEFAVLQYRGSGDESLYSKEDAAYCLSALKKALHDEYARLVPARKSAALLPAGTTRRLGFRFREAPEAKLRVEIQAYDQNGAPARLWTQEYGSVESCVAGARAFAEQVAGDLADLK